MEAIPETPGDDLGEKKWFYNLTPALQLAPNFLDLILFLQTYYLKQPYVWRQAMVASGLQIKNP